MCVCELTSKIIRNRVISSINSLLAQLFRLALIFSLSLTPHTALAESSVHCFCVFSVCFCLFSFPSFTTRFLFLHSFHLLLALSLSCCSPPKKTSAPPRPPPSQNNTTKTTKIKSENGKRGGREQRKERKKAARMKNFLVIFPYILHFESRGALARALDFELFSLFFPFFLDGVNEWKWKFACFHFVFVVDSLSLSLSRHDTMAGYGSSQPEISLFLAQILAKKRRTISDLEKKLNSKAREREAEKKSIKKSCLSPDHSSETKAQPKRKRE